MRNHNPSVMMHLCERHSITMCAYDISDSECLSHVRWMFLWDSRCKTHSFVFCATFCARFSGNNHLNGYSVSPSRVSRSIGASASLDPRTVVLESYETTLPLCQWPSNGRDHEEQWCGRISITLSGESEIDSTSHFSNEVVCTVTFGWECIHDTINHSSARRVQHFGVVFD